MPEAPDDTQSLPLKRAYKFLSERNLSAESETIRTSNDRALGYPKTRLKRGKIVTLLKQRGLLDEFIKTEWPNGNREDGKRRLKTYFNLYDRWTSGVDQADNAEEEEDGEFAEEDDLRDYLAKNLEILGKGMTLWAVPKEEENSAVEYKVDDGPRRIDILARDKEANPVVIELKVSRGHERTVGQSLYYRARIRKLLKAKKVRVIIVAREISDELREAASEAPDIELFQYRLSMTVSKIETVHQ